MMGQPSFSSAQDKRHEAARSDHPISITRNANRVRVIFGDTVIADTARALTLNKAGYAPVHYIACADVVMKLLTPTAHASHCPYKGDANYFSISIDGRTADNPVWSYEQPFPAMAEITSYLAFYPNRVDKIEESPAR
jgi:uncharacterized protein (DUF427 family)